MKKKIRRIVNICIAVMVAGSWLGMIFIGVVYIINILINGRGEWPNTNDWYMFFRWGFPVGITIYVVIAIVTWLLAFVMRKAQSKVIGR